MKNRSVEIGQDIDKAIEILKASDVVAIPTETVYGLAGNAFDVKAVARIFKVKKRPSFDPLIIHTDKLEKVRGFVEHLPEKAIKLAEKFWPGPLTLLLPKKDIIPDLVTSGSSLVAVRIPDHELALSLLSKIDFPLAAPSANPFGYISPTTASHVAQQLGNDIKYILNGGSCEIGIESSIVGFEADTAVIYRMGGLRIEAIEEIVGQVKVMPHSSSNPLAPGMLKSHYAPRKPLYLGTIQELVKKHGKENTAILSFDSYFEGIDPKKQFVLSENSDMEEAARNLFAAMRHLDSLEVDQIIAEYVPEEGLGRAINDRLKRASFR